MHHFQPATIALLSLLTVAAASAQTSDPLLATALADDPAGAAAIAELRAAGQAGLDRVLKAADEDQSCCSSQFIQDWDRLIDAVGSARGDRAARLFWYTDLAAAKQAAQQSRRPIVALRLLGKLTDEFSCANSRFFRTVLYPDPKVSAWLRDHVVLYWSSERPVPQVSIDFGDGRLLRTTLGGNSVHLVLAADGSPVDALPGLYAPAAFLARLQDAARCADDYASGSAERGMKVLANYHHQALLAEGKVLAGFGINSPPVLDEEGEWTAAAAQALTTRKSLVELPVLRAVGMVPTGATTGDPSALPPFPITMLAMLTAGMPRLGELSPESRGIIVWHLQSSGALPSGSPTLEEQAIAHVQVDLAQDTIIDEYALHAAIHRHRLGHPGEGMEALTAWIYRRVFRTPASDPWLGMRPAAWDGLEHREVVAERAPR